MATDEAAYAVTDINILGIILATFVAYLLGALPIAAWVSRRRGIDIFNVGTGLPGASNVRRNVGNVSGGMVLIGDMAKGLLSIVAAKQMQVDGLWLLLPCAAMVAGHWKSIFTGFRGGDGIAPFGGAVIALFPWNGFIAAVVASLVTLGGQKLPYSSLMGTVVGVAALIWLAIVNPMGIQEELQLAVGTGCIAAMVLLHASIGHRRRNATTDELIDIDDLDDPEGVRG